MENNIVYETDDFYVWEIDPRRFEIRCHSSSRAYSVAVGEKDNLNDAIRTVNRLEPNVDRYRAFAGIN